MKTNKAPRKNMDNATRLNMRESLSINDEMQIRNYIAELELGNALTDLDTVGTPLMYTAWRGCPIAARLLLEKSQVKNDINYDYNGFSALKIAVKGSEGRYFEVAKLLIANGATITEDIKEAARRGKNPQTIALLANPAAMENLRTNPSTLMAVPATYSATSSAAREPR